MVHLNDAKSAVFGGSDQGIVVCWSTNHCHVQLTDRHIRYMADIVCDEVSSDRAKDRTFTPEWQLERP
jgi:hypothetical protein